MAIQANHRRKISTLYNITTLCTYGNLAAFTDIFNNVFLHY
jgi:hypothetical protein